MQRDSASGLMVKHHKLGVNDQSVNWDQSYTLLKGIIINESDYLCNYRHFHVFFLIYTRNSNTTHHPFRSPQNGTPHQTTKQLVSHPHSWPEKHPNNKRHPLTPLGPPKKPICDLHNLVFVCVTFFAVRRMFNMFCYSTLQGPPAGQEDAPRGIIYGRGKWGAFH